MINKIVSYIMVICLFCAVPQVVFADETVITSPHAVLMEASTGKIIYEKEKDVVTGIVQRYVGKNISINLGKVDAILLTGGMARDTELCDKLAEYISWIAPIYNYAGSFETEALGFGAIRVLKGDEEAKTYTGKPVWNGFPWDKE